MKKLVFVSVVACALLAGTVQAVGPGVTRFRPGDEVFGMVGGVGGRPGTLAEFVSADEDLLAAKPDVVLTPAEVMDFVAGHVAPHKRVRACEFIDEIQSLGKRRLREKGQVELFNPKKS